MKIGILGTRGVPNFYGGFEQFAAYLSKYLVNKGHEVWVYNSNLHPYQESTWEGVSIIHCYDLEDKIGTAGQFVYDLNCILDSRKRGFDVLLQLGYTSSSIWGRLLPSQSIIVTNMDGLEWKRSKFNTYVQRFLRYAESLAVKRSDFLVSDSIGIQNYIQNKYDRSSEYIAYGADLFKSPDVNVLEKYGIAKYSYHLLIARMEPENNIEVILDGYCLSQSEEVFLVVGKTENTFARYLIDKYKSYSNIRFLGGIYDLNELNNLRYFCRLYFHGHSVGGTNPSLLEAMASSALIVAHNNIFNQTILEKSAFYFENKEDIAKYVNADLSPAQRNNMISENLNKIEHQFSWEKIVSSYEDLFIKLKQKN